MLLSRVAENLYWTNRYVERAESLARLLHAGYFLELDAAGLASDGYGQGPIQGVLTIMACRDAFQQAYGPGDRDTILRFLTFDRDHPGSILSMIARARENARGAQETISAEIWHQINRFYLYLCGPRATRRFQASPFRFYDLIKQECLLFAAQVDSTLPRDEVFHFLQVGRQLERVDQISRIVHAKCDSLYEVDPSTVTPIRLVHWTSLLRSCSAYEVYLRTYHDRVEPESIVRCLVLDPEFPRAIRFCIDRCRESLHEISGSSDADYGSEAERLLGRLDGELRYIDVDEIFDRGLSNFLAGVQETCNRVGAEIHRAYFAT